MNELFPTLKEKIIYFSIFIVALITLFFSGVLYGYRRATRKGEGTNSVTELVSDISRLKSENERLTAERDGLIEDLSVSNGKLETIVNELQEYNNEFAEQTDEYNRRTEKYNGDILEYNRIYSEQVFRLCEIMERTILTIARACEVDNGEIE